MKPFDFDAKAIADIPRLAIYGAGRLGRVCLEALKAVGRQGSLAAFVDRDPGLAGRRVGGVEVQAPEWLEGQADLAVVIGIAPPFDEEARESAGRFLPADRIITCVPGNLTGELNRFQGQRGGPAGTQADRRSLSQIYETDDPYTTGLINFFTAYKNELPAIFQPYDHWRDFIELSPFSERYWNDVPHILNSDDDLTLLDLGAYDGDTLASAAFVFGRRLAKIYAFEPVRRHFERLLKTVSGSVLAERIECLNLASGNVNGPARLERAGEASRVTPDGPEEAIIRRIDDLPLEIKGRLFIKMDIEGFELEALQGAARTIAEQRPELAICVYHKALDLWAIPAYIRQLVPEYRFILRGGRMMVCYGSTELNVLKGDNQ